jgi:hypothetical protein
MTIWRTRIACWIPKATNRHSEYVVILNASPLQQWLHESAPVLLFSYMACLVDFTVTSQPPAYGRSLVSASASTQYESTTRMSLT